MSKSLVVTCLALSSIIACDSPGGGGKTLHPVVTIDPADSGASPDTGLATADDAVASEDATTAPDDATTAPDDATATTIAPDDTTVAPDDTTVATSDPDDVATTTTTPETTIAPSCASLDDQLASAPILLDVEGAIWSFGASGNGDLGLGGTASDWIALQFMNAATGVFELADEAPGPGCVHCTLLRVDDGAATMRDYRPINGTLTVTSSPSGEVLDVTYRDVDFVDADDLEGGACLHVDELHLRGTRPDTTPPTCVTLPALGTLSVEDAGSFYMAVGDGSPVQRLYVQTFSPELGFFSLTSAANSNYATCAQCVLLAEDPQPNGGYAHFYFQTAGTISIAEGSDPMGATPRLDAQMVGVELREVTLDPTTFESELVPGGGCFNIPLSFVSTN